MEQKITKGLLDESYEKLEVRAKPDLDFILLTATAAAICTFGFKMNSPSVIIGAMVLSPLLMAVVAIGTSIYWKKWRNALRNIFALALGVFIAMSISYIINRFFEIGEVSEITTRILGSPSDYFFVAFFSGLGGTFAYFWPGIIEAIAGIAISVALIPPVVMVGISLANWNMLMLTASLQIVAVNILGIVVGSFILVVGLHIYAQK